MSVAIGTGAIWPGIPPAGQSLAHAYLEQPLAPRNSVELSREMLFTLLEYLSTMIYSEFSGMPIRLVAHGGACMLLHNGLHELANRKAMHHSSRGENVARRTTTRDVDYIHRSFIAESTSRGIINPGERLQKCIQATARQFRLGADWMNSDADVALPMSTDPNTGASFDPIYTESVKENNVQLYTVFTSSNKLLSIVSVTPFWAVALKLVRYTKWDPGDICLILLYGSVARRPGVQWTAETLEGWIRCNCSAMNYHNWDSSRVLDMKHKIMHAVALISSIGTSVMAQSGDPILLPSFPPHASPPSGTESSFYSSVAHRALSPNSSVNASMGWAGPASDVIAAEISRSTAPSPVKAQNNTDTSRPLVEDYERPPFSELKSKSTVPAHSRHSSTTNDQKKDSRRREKRSREQERIMRRRSKYMLRSDEPDDSDEDSGSSTDMELGNAKGKANHPTARHAPVIPLSMSQSSLPSFDSPPPQALRPWGSTSALLPDHHSWTQTHITQEPIAMDSSLSRTSPTHHPPPTSEPRGLGLHSQSWPVAHQPHELPPRRWLTSPLLEPPIPQPLSTQPFR